MIELFNDNSVTFIKSELFKTLTKDREVIIVTDPPFNVGYHYNTYKDKLPEEQYYSMLKDIFGDFPFVVIHYPENIYRISHEVGKIPQKVVAWVYNSNTPKQHRDIAFFDIKPDFTKVTQPYKNPNDKRIQARIARGIRGGRLYDWWNINQIKNVSSDKTAHPCQMPLAVMENIIGILPRDSIIVDPFLGSGTTGCACKKYEVDFIGIEQDQTYFNIAKERINNFQVQSKLF